MTIVVSQSFQVRQRIANSLWLVLLIGAIVLIFSCNGLKKNKSHQDIPDASIEKGKILAATWCQSCHILPDPSQLDATSWEEGVLPAMGPRLGIYDYDFKHYPSSRYDDNLPENFYPRKAVLTSVEWQYIIDYYTAISPDLLPGQQRSKTIQTGLPGFKVEVPGHLYPSPAICFTKIDTTRSPHQLLTFDLSGKYIFSYDSQLSVIDSAKSAATITDIDFHNDTMLACNINVINPNNGRFGKANYLGRRMNDKLETDTIALFDNLARPVQVSSCDLNLDRKTDYLICEFGNLTGALSWMENTGDNKFVRHVLREEPGAIKAYIDDYNQDGLPDVWALFTQGQEAIYLFINRGNGKFEPTRVLSFPALYGSTYFELTDFNKDGLNDIVYTCGDNADYSTVLKPYHGVYIFLNQGENKFKQQYFFPINGCFKAIPRDYDRDGDIDIATIAFFADFASQPEEGFVYLRNNGHLDFEPFTIPESKTGRWLTLDAGDLDADGKIDIVLGNFSVRPSVITPRFDWKKGPPFIFLRNISQ